MAPEVALEELGRLPAGSTVLDPMMGSGTVLKAALHQHLRAIGRDIDPLAVLMARVWTTRLDTQELRRRAVWLLEQARAQLGTALPWIDNDAETTAFVNYWFAQPQQSDLRGLSAALLKEQGAIGDALRLALSRIIVTKDLGASLARDVSHSRPHRTRLSTPFSVREGFLRAVEQIASRLEAHPLPGTEEADVAREDARHLASLADQTIDVVLTSPPYLNAIDYLRGHRLALVWLGYSLRELRAIRAASIGAERGPENGASLTALEALLEGSGFSQEIMQRLPSRERGMLQRYLLDLARLLAEIKRVLRPGGRAIFVMGTSCLRGVLLHNALFLCLLAQSQGFRLERSTERELPPNRRYLPPPRTVNQILLKRRMHTETIVTLSLA